MAKQNPLKSMMEKPLSRKEFLQHIGVLLLAVVGISQVMQQLTKQSGHSNSKAKGSSWGGGKFGA